MKIVIETADTFDMRTLIIVTTDGKVRHAGDLTSRERSLLNTVLDEDLKATGGQPR